MIKMFLLLFSMNAFSNHVFQDCFKSYENKFVNLSNEFHQNAQFLEYLRDVGRYEEFDSFQVIYQALIDHKIDSIRTDLYICIKNSEGK